MTFPRLRNTEEAITFGKKMSSAMCVEARVRCAELEQLVKFAHDSEKKLLLAHEIQLLETAMKTFFYLP